MAGRYTVGDIAALILVSLLFLLQFKLERIVTAAVAALIVPPTDPFRKHQALDNVIGSHLFFIPIGRHAFDHQSGMFAGWLEA